ncbi:unnamed protein product [Linum trigynum]|uniref:Uncharacterized protein n=1 Tax=Linum trigynum TaxID=586398 RepID=A0AAV2CHK7_9ROSI
MLLRRRVLIWSTDNNSSPYHKLNSIKRSDRYRPSPELQPLPPLPKPPPPSAAASNLHPRLPPRPVPAVVRRPEYESSGSPSSGEESSNGTPFYTPAGSAMSNNDGFYTPVSGSTRRHYSRSNDGTSLRLVNVSNNGSSVSVPDSKRTSPKWRLSSSVYSPEMKHVIIPSTNKPYLEPPPRRPPPREGEYQHNEQNQKLPRRVSAG